MYKTVDLFAGAGGLSYGFESTGKFTIVAAAENNKYARMTYIDNHKENSNIIMIPDVRGYNYKDLMNEVGDIDIVIGGPPCQGFSNANRQKNHIISMNNTLVKEFFRAIQEIHPKAFVMENVNTLLAESHRFYDSAIDHDIVIKMGVSMKNEDLVISDADYNGFSLFNIFMDHDESSYQISDDLFQLLNVLYKDRNNAERLPKFLNKRSKELIKAITLQSQEIKQRLTFLDETSKIIRTEEFTEEYFDELGKFIKFQKAFRLKKELDENQILYSLKNDPITGKIVAQVQSYTVREYVDKNLGDEYKVGSNVINSQRFGVPQERRRFIMMGVRSDIARSGEIVIPEGDIQIPVTVGEAISDLEAYCVDEVHCNPELIPYKEEDNVLTEYEKKMRDGSAGIKNHIVPRSSQIAKKRFSALKEGENFHDLGAALKKNYSVPERTQNSIYQRLDSNKPCGTVINVRKSMWIHPTLDRAISVREAARLQSFPDKFVFKGTKDSQYQQIGNAVPPMMAKAVAEALLNYL